MLAVRMRVIERNTGIRFDQGSVPILRLQDLTIGCAQYDSGTREISFDRNDLSKIINGHGCGSLEGTADHELGHMLMDQVSRRTGNGPWPPPLEKRLTLSPERMIGIKMVSEGFAEWTETGGSCSKAASPKLLPAKNETLVSHGREPERMIYDGGCWLVRDIVSSYGERGLIWIIKHPFVYDPRDVRSSAEAYRGTALAKLSR